VKFKKIEDNFIKMCRFALSTHRWSLMYKNINSNKYIDIEQPSNLSRADSFIIESNNKIYIFFEEFATGPFYKKGHLSVGELDINRNKLINIQNILEKKYHLSYPFIFKYNSAWYAIPETHQNNSIDLYKFTLFPYAMEKVRTLVDNINAVDTTLTIKDSIVYLFTNIKRHGKDHSNNLSLFFSDDLLNGSFAQHPMNPLVTDNRYARMAGGFLKEGGTLYRFAQDCSINYGACMYKFEIIELTKNKYKEDRVESLYRPQECLASHTFNKSKNFIVIDVQYRAKSAVQFFRNIGNLFLLAFKKVIGLKK